METQQEVGASITVTIKVSQDAGGYTGPVTVGLAEINTGTNSGSANYNQVSNLLFDLMSGHWHLNFTVDSGKWYLAYTHADGAANVMGMAQGHMFTAGEVLTLVLKSNS